MMDAPELTQGHDDKVPGWRLAEILRLFPDMEVAQAQDLAINGDHTTLEQARYLRAHNCAAQLAYRIMRAL